jgi:WD40 repeat protein/tRNA A-37 threonylcarbamoyl transferase component Bud32
MPMDALSKRHPTDQTLQSFGLGKLDDASNESVQEHLEGCAECRRKVAEITSDSFLIRLRQAQAQPDSPPPFGSSLPALPEMETWARPQAQETSSTIPPDLAADPDYEILGELGRGGMGVVYLAQNKLMGRKEVLKVVSRELMDRRGVADRFLREIRNAAQLHHTNIVTAYSAFRAGEYIVFAMEYVEGYDLAKMVKAHGALPVAHACNFAYQAAQGLQYAHEKGMVHRDIKPSNLMLSRHEQKAVIKILDFGLAKATREGPVDNSLTHEGQMLGTPDYIAPEQSLDAQKADIRADIYSLGCTLYYLLTGSPPFRGASVYEVLQAHHSMDAKPLNLARPEVPWELAAAVGRMMAKDPEQRQQTPREVAQSLKPFFKSGPVRPGASTRPAGMTLTTGGQEAVITALLLEEAGEHEPESAQMAMPRGQQHARHPRRPVAIAASVLGGVLLFLSALLLFVATRKNLARSSPAPGQASRPLAGAVNPPDLEANVDRARLSAASPDVAAKPKPSELSEKPATLKSAEARNVLPPIASKPAAPAPRFPVVRLKATDQEASDGLRRADIPEYELLVAGQGDRSKAPGGLVAVIGDSRLNEGSWIQSLAITRAGKTLITALPDGCHATIWDLADGKIQQSLDLSDTEAQKAQRFLYQRLAFSPDGRTAATAAHALQDGRLRTIVRMWDTATGRARSILELGLDPQFTVATPQIGALVFSPDGRFLAAGGHSDLSYSPSKGSFEDPHALVIVWDLKKRQRVLLKSSRVPARIGSCEVCFDREVKTVFALQRFSDGDRGDIMKAWHVDRGTEVPLRFEMPPRNGLKSRSFDWRLVSSRFLHDSLALIYADKTRPIKNDQVVQLPEPQEQWVIFDLTTRRERARLDIPPEFGQAVICGSSPDGTNLCLWVWPAHEGGRSGLLFWNLATKVKHWPKTGEQVWGSSGTYSPDGTKIALAGFGVRIWDVALEKETLARGRFHGRVEDLCYSPNGSSLAITVEGGVVMWDIGARRERRFFERYARPIAFSPDGRKLAASYKKQVLLIDLGADPQNLTLADWSHSSSYNDEASCLAFSSNGASIGLGYRNGKVEVVDASTGKPRQQYRGIASNVTSIAFSPDGRLLAASGDDAESHPVSELFPGNFSSYIDPSDAASRKSSRVIKLWNVARGELHRTIRGPEGPVAFSSDSRELATGGFEYVGKAGLPLWSLDTFSPYFFYGGPGYAGTHHGFSPDGETIATSGGGMVRLWSSSGGKERGAIRVCYPTGQINAVAFSPTGRYLATANGNGTVCILKLKDR